MALNAIEPTKSQCVVIFFSLLPSLCHCHPARMIVFNFFRFLPVYLTISIDFCNENDVNTVATKVHAFKCNVKKVIISAKNAIIAHFKSNCVLCVFFLLFACDPCILFFLSVLLSSLISPSHRQQL